MVLHSTTATIVAVPQAKHYLVLISNAPRMSPMEEG